LLEDPDLERADREIKEDIVITEVPVPEEPGAEAEAELEE
jgi:hypothetical protein